MPRSGPKKLFNFHFTCGEEDGERFLALVERLQLPKSDVAREAILFYVVLAETAPPDLSRHKLGSFLEDVLATTRPAPRPAPSNGHHPSPSATDQQRRPRTDSQGSRRK